MDKTGKLLDELRINKELERIAAIGFGDIQPVAELAERRTVINRLLSEEHDALWGC